MTLQRAIGTTFSISPARMRARASPIMAPQISGLVRVSSARETPRSSGPVAAAAENEAAAAAMASSSRCSPARSATRRKARSPEVP